MKTSRWGSVVFVIVVAGLVGKIAGHSAGESIAQTSIAKQQFYAITKARHKENGRTVVSIVLTDDKKDCEPLLSGRRKGHTNPSNPNPMTIELEQCVANLNADWLPAFNNKAVKGAYSVAYKMAIWPTRELFFDFDPRLSPQDTCAALVNLYKSKTSDVQCIPPARP